MLPPPDGLYVHLPFCLQRCRYCAFVSHVYDPDLADAYLAALEIEAAERAGDLEAGARTVYIGGGTPTVLDLPQLDRLLYLVRDMEDGAPAEFTVEANPGTLTVEKLLLLKDAGVTRVSLGVQSFHHEALDLLGRIHTAKEARAGVAMCREVGIEDISLDLIFGWPGQTPRLWRADLEQALALEVPHLSCYGLTVEPGTDLAGRVAAGQVTLPGEEEGLTLFRMTEVVLDAAGRARYEISNFARPGYACRHNINYWTGGDYLGLGAGAYSFLGGARTANAPAVATYIDGIRQKGAARAFHERLPPDRRARECAVVWLRMTRGIDTRRFAQRTGFDLADLLGGDLPPLLEGGWLAWSDDGLFLHLTPKAVPVADTVLAELVV